MTTIKKECKEDVSLLIEPLPVEHLSGTKQEKPLQESTFDHMCDCDFCAKPILGVRWNCEDCDDWDCCDGCVVRYKNEHPPAHRLLPITDPSITEAGRQPAVHHEGASCRGCGQDIFGIRYRCSHPSCDDYDLCDICESHPIPRHNLDHIMLKIRDSRTWKAPSPAASMSSDNVSSDDSQSSDHPVAHTSQTDDPPRNPKQGRTKEATQQEEDSFSSDDSQSSDPPLAQTQTDDPPRNPKKKRKKRRTKEATQEEEDSVSSDDSQSSDSSLAHTSQTEGPPRNHKKRRTKEATQEEINGGLEEIVPQVKKSQIETAKPEKQRLQSNSTRDDDVPARVQKPFVKDQKLAHQSFPPPGQLPWRAPQLKAETRDFKLAPFHFLPLPVRIWVQENILDVCVGGAERYIIATILQPFSATLRTRKTLEMILNKGTNSNEMISHLIRLDYGGEKKFYLVCLRDGINKKSWPKCAQMDRGVLCENFNSDRVGSCVLFDVEFPTPGVAGISSLYLGITGFQACHVHEDWCAHFLEILRHESQAEPLGIESVSEKNSRRPWFDTDDRRVLEVTINKKFWYKWLNQSVESGLNICLQKWKYVGEKPVMLDGKAMMCLKFPPACRHCGLTTIHGEHDIKCPFLLIDNRLRKQFEPSSPKKTSTRESQVEERK